MPSNLQIHEKFVNEDNEMRMARKIDRGEEPKMDDSDSDESIVAIKEQKQKLMKKIELMDLSDN